jgi:ribosomal protein S11
MDRWKAQRDAAQATFGSYGSSLVKMMPDMIKYWMSLLAPDVAEKFAYMLVHNLDIKMSGKVDPSTGRSSAYPFGRDVVITAMASHSNKIQHIRDESNLCTKVSMILEELGHNKILNERNAADIGGDGEVPTSAQTDMEYKRIVFPMVFGARVCLGTRETETVDKHYPHDEDRCMKLINGLSVEYANRHRPTIGLNPLRLDVEHLYDLLKRATEHYPILLMRGLSEFGYMGPKFFSGKECRVLMLKGMEYPFGSKTLPLAFAEHYESFIERAEDSKSSE